MPADAVEDYADHDAVEDGDDADCDHVDYDGFEGLGGDEGCSAGGGHWGLGTFCGDFRKVRGNQRREEKSEKRRERRKKANFDGLETKGW